MEKWIVGIMENQTVECTVTYEVSLGKGWGEGARLLVSPSVSPKGFICCLRVFSIYWKRSYLTNMNIGRSI